MNLGKWPFVLAAALSLVLQATIPRIHAQDEASASAVQEKIAAASLIADYEILRAALETLHPGLYRYNDRPAIEAAFDELRTELSSDRTLAEAYQAISILAAKIRCGHTYANFYNQGPAVEQAVLQGPRVPFCFRWLGDRMIVTRSFATDRPLPPGTEIIAINGTPVATIRERLMKVARADGGNDARRIRDLEVTGEARFEAFDVFFPLFSPSSSQDFELMFSEPPGGKEQTITVRSMTQEQRLAAQPTESGDPDVTPLWKLEWREDGIAYWRMPSWVAYKGSWNWRNSIKSIFDELTQRRAPALIIDLRGNEGGTTEIADVILSRLIREPLDLGNVRQLVRFRTVPERLLPYLSTWDPSYQRLGEKADDTGDGWFQLRSRDGSKIAPRGERFNGKVFVLMDAANSSATFRFALLAQRHGLATLVGQPTGGNQRGTNGGAIYFLRLPNSQIELDIPLIGYFPEGHPPDAGLRPDVQVELTREDLALGRDATLEKAVELIHELSH